jgi:hypothetical protein
MGWEIRQGKRYYYRKRRVNGRIRSIYCGSGEKGEAAEREDLARRSTSEVPDFRDIKKEPVPAIHFHAEQDSAIALLVKTVRDFRQMGSPGAQNILDVWSARDKLKALEYSEEGKPFYPSPEIRERVQQFVADYQTATPSGKQYVLKQLIRLGYWTDGTPLAKTL